MVVRLWQMIYLSFKLGKFIPFKIYTPLKIRLRSGAKIVLGSRLILGNKRKELSSSCNGINFSFGKNSLVSFGKGVSLGPGVSLVVKEEAKLLIGENTYFTSDAHVEVVNQINIGKNCAISWGVTILDSDHHRLVISGKERKIIEETIIGNHVWIGCNCTLLCGSNIGNNCVVAAGSVVKGSFPDNSLIAGNPARVVKSDIDWQ